MIKKNKYNMLEKIMKDFSLKSYLIEDFLIMKAVIKGNLDIIKLLLKYVKSIKNLTIIRIIKKSSKLGYLNIIKYILTRFNDFLNKNNIKFFLNFVNISFENEKIYIVYYFCSFDFILNEVKKENKKIYKLLKIRENLKYF